jgi:small-conductance mechanosensitive channel
MTQFGESSFDFRLRFWISDPYNGLTNLRGEVLLALWDAFKVADIDIPFPHREIIMRNPVEIVPRRSRQAKAAKTAAPDAFPWSRGPER